MSKQEIEFTKRPCIILLGNVFDGYKFIGPFHNWDEAQHYADNSIDCVGYGYQIATLEEKELK
jgi:hypothetical protein